MMYSMCQKKSMASKKSTNRFTGERRVAKTTAEGDDALGTSEQPTKSDESVIDHVMLKPPGVWTVASPKDVDDDKDTCPGSASSQGDEEISSEEEALFALNDVCDFVSPSGSAIMQSDDANLVPKIPTMQGAKSMYTRHKTKLRNIGSAPLFVPGSASPRGEQDVASGALSASGTSREVSDCANHQKHMFTRSKISKYQGQQAEDIHAQSCNRRSALSTSAAAFVPQSTNTPSQTMTPQIGKVATPARSELSAMAESFVLHSVDHEWQQETENCSAEAYCGEFGGCSHDHGAAFSGFEGPVASGMSNDLYEWIPSDYSGSADCWLDNQIGDSCAAGFLGEALAAQEHQLDPSFWNSGVSCEFSNGLDQSWEFSPSNLAADSQLLPDGWDSATDPKDGRTYYFNRSSGVTQWTRPESASSISSDVCKSNEVGGLPAGWETATDTKSGRVYFYNLLTKVTQWRRPEQVTAKAKVLAPPPGVWLDRMGTPSPGASLADNVQAAESLVLPQPMKPQKGPLDLPVEWSQVSWAELSEQDDELSLP